MGEMTKERHHELCLGVLACCYEHVPHELKLAIREGVEAARKLGFPVDEEALGKRPIYVGQVGHS